MTCLIWLANGRKIAGCLGIKVEKASRIDSVRDAGTSNTLPVDFEEIRARQDVTKVGRVGVVISLTML